MGLFGPSDQERRRRERERQAQDRAEAERRAKLEQVQLTVGPTAGQGRLVAGVASDADVRDLDEEIEDDDVNKRAYELALERLQEAALDADATAVVNVRFESTYDSEYGMLVITAYGDAVPAVVAEQS